MPNIRSYKARVYQAAIEAAMRIFELSKNFPPEERYSLTDQIRRSSRSVCTKHRRGLAQAPVSAHFVSKMSDSEGEAEETRVWIEIARRCRYLTSRPASPCPVSPCLRVPCLPRPVSPCLRVPVSPNPAQSLHSNSRRLCLGAF
jgi:four helix bundle protein